MGQRGRRRRERSGEGRRGEDKKRHVGIQGSWVKGRKGVERGEEERRGREERKRGEGR